MFSALCLTISSASTQKSASVIKTIASGSAQTAYKGVDLRRENRTNPRIHTNSLSYFCRVLTKVKICGQILEQTPKTKFRKSPRVQIAAFDANGNMEGYDKGKSRFSQLFCGRSA